MLAHSESSPGSSEFNYDPAGMDNYADQSEHNGSFLDGDDDAELGEGDYSRHLEDIMSDGGLDEDEHNLSDIPRFADDDDDDEEFVYTGVDTGEPFGGYQERLRDVLGEDHDDESEDLHIVEKSLVHEVESTSPSVDDQRVSLGQVIRAR